MGLFTLLLTCLILCVRAWNALKWKDYKSRIGDITAGPGSVWRMLLSKDVTCKCGQNQSAGCIPWSNLPILKETWLQLALVFIHSSVRRKHVILIRVTGFTVHLLLLHGVATEHNIFWIIRVPTQSHMWWSPCFLSWSANHHSHVVSNAASCLAVISICRCNSVPPCMVLGGGSEPTETHKNMSSVLEHWFIWSSNSFTFSWFDPF